MPLPLVTQRLLIRPFTLEDAGDFHAIVGDPEVMAEIPGGTSPSVEKTREKIGRIISYYDTWGYCLWALIEKETGEMVGNCGLILVEGKGPETEVSYDIAKKHWGKGYATEAASVCVEYGFRELCLEKIIAITFPHHAASRRIMEKIRLKFLETKNYYDREMVVYGLTRKEFLNLD